MTLTSENATFILMNEILNFFEQWINSGRYLLWSWKSLQLWK
jgi:hypothetical protein